MTSIKQQMIARANAILKPQKSKQIDPNYFGLHKLTNAQLYSLLHYLENLANKELSNGN